MNPHELMQRAVEDRSPDLDHLTRVATAQGRRLRRRRQGLVVTGAAVAVAAVCGVTLVGPGAERDLRPAGDPTTSASPSPTPTVTTGTARLTGPGAAAALRELVATAQPAGTATHLRSQGPGGSDGELYTELWWQENPSAGVSVVGLNVQPDEDYHSSCADGLAECSSYERPDGSLVTQYVDRTPVAGGVGLRQVVDVMRPDRTRVVISATNGFDLPKNGWEVTREAPALGTFDLMLIAVDDWWTEGLPERLIEQGEELEDYESIDDSIDGASPTAPPAPTPSSSSASTS